MCTRIPRQVFVFSTTSIIWLSVVFMLSCLRCFCFLFAPIDPLSFWFFVFTIFGVGGSGWSALHINVLFLCYLFTFSNLCYLFFIVFLLPFVFSREVGSLHLFVSRRLIFLFLLLYICLKKIRMSYCALLLNFFVF